MKSEPKPIALVCTLLSLGLPSCSQRKTPPMEPLDENTAYQLTETIHASNDRLFDAFLDPDVLKEIWGLESITVDGRVGANTHAVMPPDLQQWNFTITYQELVKPDRLKWVVHFPNHPGKETRVSILLTGVPRGTQVTVSQQNFENAEERDANRNAWTNALKTLQNRLGR